MFTVEELTIINMYCGPQHSRSKLIHELESILPLVEVPEIRQTIHAILEKAKPMTDSDFEELEFRGLLLK